MYRQTLLDQAARCGSITLLSGHRSYINMTFDGLETKLREYYPKATACSRRAKVNLARFADDFVITGSSKELLETEVKPLVAQFLHKRGLELSPEKTRITHITDGFEFLGQQVRAYKGKILVKPSRKSV